VALVARWAIPTKSLDNDLVTIRKYYKPITGLAASTRIFSRIVNVPCHPGLARLDDRQLSELFGRLSGTDVD
jgi:hypothetical protein